MPKFNVATGKVEYMPWEIPMDQIQAQSLPEQPKAAPQPAPPVPAAQLPDMMQANGATNPEGYNQLMRQIDAAMKADRMASGKSLAGQEAGVSQLEQTLNDLKGLGPAIDFSPLAGAFDSIYGTNQAATLKGETPDQRAQKLFEMQSKIQQAKDALAENRVKATSQDLSHLMAKSNLMNSKQDRFDQSQIEKADLEMRGKFNKVLDGANELAGTYSRLNTAFQPDQNGQVSAYQVQQAMSNFARSVGGEKGVLTDADVARQLPQSMQLKLATLENKIFGLSKDAKIDQADIAPLREIVAKAKQVSLEKYQETLDRNKKLYEGSPGKFTQQVWQTAGKSRYQDAQNELNKNFKVDKPAEAASGLDAEFEAYKRGQK